MEIKDMPIKKGQEGMPEADKIGGELESYTNGTPGKQITKINYDKYPHLAQVAARLFYERMRL